MKLKLSLLLIIIAFGYVQLGFSHDESSDMHYTSSKEVVTISYLNNSFIVKGNIVETRKFNISASHDFATEFVYENQFMLISNLKATYSEYQSNGKYKNKNVKLISKKSNVSNSVFYDDNSYYEIEFPNITKGSTTTLSYNYSIPDIHFLKAHFFSDYYPVHESVFEIVADSNIQIGYYICGSQKDEIVFQKTPMGVKTKYTWTLKNCKPYTPEDSSPGFKYEATQIIPFVKSYRVNGKLTRVLGETADLFTWYQSLVDQVDTQENDSLVQLTHQIIEGVNTDREKAERIFSWVQHNIRYVAFEDGWRGFIPYPAHEICTKRYGDCKDMAHLTCTMLKIAGLNAEHAWVGTRKLPYTYTELPSPYVDNHMVVALKLDNEIFVLDATDAYTPFGVPSTFILSKQIMFNNNGQFEIYEVPDFDPDYCVFSNNINLKVEDMSLVGSGVVRMETFEYSFFKNYYSIMNENRKRFMDDYLELGNNNFYLEEYKLTEPDTGKNCRIDYKFEIPGHIKKFGKSMFVNMNLNTPYKEWYFQTNRKNDITLEFKEAYVDTITIQIPEGVHEINTPGNYSYDGKFGSVKCSYEKTATELKYYRRVTINAILIPVEELNEWNQFIKSLHQVYTSTVEVIYES